MKNTFFICFVLAFCMINKVFSQEIAQEKRDLKILVLIISSDERHLYKKLQKIWKSYMHLDRKHVEAYFIKANRKLHEDFAIKGDVIWSKTKESFRPGILNKTLLTMQHLIPRIDEFDYILRTNLSSFYVFPKLLKFLETLPKKGCYCGAKLTSYHGSPFGWGCGFILTPDLVKKLVQNKKNLLNMIYDNDDVVIGDFFHQKNIPIIPAPLMEIYSLVEWREKRNKFLMIFSISE